MQFDKFLDQLASRLSVELPAAKAHEPLRATPLGPKFPMFEHKSPPKAGSVLILLYEKDGIIHFPLIKRPTYTGTHSAQVSLPGGKVEQDENAFQAALREAHEEIGVIQKDIRVIGRLSDFNVIPSNFIVAPVVAVIDYVPEFIPDKREVEIIIEAKLSDIISENAIQEKEIVVAGVYHMMAPHFLIKNEIVWGATAMMLNELRLIVKEILNR